MEAIFLNIWNLIFKNLKSPKYKLMLAISFVSILAYLASQCHSSYRDSKTKMLEIEYEYKARIYESDNEYKARALESNNLREVELAKLKHSHLQQTPGNRNNSPP